MAHIKTTFSLSAIRKAAAVIRVFETGRATGDPTAVAVLDDGAGVSYGISQFTHRSGSLAAVVRRYLELGGTAEAGILAEHLPILGDRSERATATLAESSVFRSALRSAGMTAEMRAAQEEVAFERYMLPAVQACEGSGFVLPLSLAVIFDAMTHGSYEKIRDRVSPRLSEKAWITEFVRKRHTWLGSIPRLAKTRYRTRFFLEQIMTGRWDLALPLRVHGVLLTEELLDIPASAAGCPATTGPAPHLLSAPTTSNSLPQTPPLPSTAMPAPLAAVQRAACTCYDDSRTLDRVEPVVNAAIENYDRIERMSLAVIDRTDRAKSLWTTVAATAWQAGWAIIGTLSGVPREVWFAVAAITAATMLFYLYRQVALGKIRERRQVETACINKSI